METKNIDFIARHYRKGRFAVNEGWRRLGIAPVGFWKRYKIAAAIAAAVFLSATAAILFNEYRIGHIEQPELTSPAVTPLAQVKVIDFENASLSEVVSKIEDVYGVKVENMPVSTEGYELSLHYEGTPRDLISVINDILGTQMTVAEK